MSKSLNVLAHIFFYSLGISFLTAMVCLLSLPTWILGRYILSVYGVEFLFKQAIAFNLIMICIVTPIVATVIVSIDKHKRKLL